MDVLAFRYTRPPCHPRLGYGWLDHGEGMLGPWFYGLVKTEKVWNQQEQRPGANPLMSSLCGQQELHWGPLRRTEKAPELVP